MFNEVKVLTIFFFGGGAGFCPCLESKGAFAQRGMDLTSTAFASMYGKLKRLGPGKLSSINGSQLISLKVLCPGLNPEKPID